MGNSKGKCLKIPYLEYRVPLAVINMSKNWKQIMTIGIL
jgi:hypothetical protein